MPSLHDMQRGFAAALLDSGATRTPLIRADGLSPAMRLGFYRTNVIANYTRALRLTYPAIERLVGSERFLDLAKHYIQRYPCSAGDLTTFGDQFGEYLSHVRGACDLPYLADVARLEWALEEAYHEANHPELNAERIAALPLDRCVELRFMLHPAARLMRSAYPLRGIWNLTRAREGDPVDIAEGGECLLIRRDGFDVVVEPLNPGAYAMLLALSTGENFGTGFDYARETDTGFDPGNFLRTFVGNRVLVDFALPAQAIQ